MGRFLFIVFTLFIFLYTNGCGSKGNGGDGEITWSKTFGKGYDDEAYSIQQTSDGGYVVAGYTDLYGTQDADYLVLKLNSHGNIIWEKTFGGIADDRASSIQQTSDGGYIVAGYTNSYGAGDGDYWVLKLDSDGNTIWDKTFGDIDFDAASSIKQTSDGGYIVAGHKSPSGAWVIKLDSNGNILWDMVFGGKNTDMVSSIQQTSDGGYIVAGATIPLGESFSDVWVIKLNKYGEMMWEKIFGGIYYDYAYSIQQTSDGGYIVAGSTEKSNYSGFSSFRVVKLDLNGNISWDKIYEKRHFNVAKSIYQTSDGGYIVAGAIEWIEIHGGRRNTDFWIIRIDSTGNLIWDKIFGDYAPEAPYSIQQTSDGGYIVAGYALSYRVYNDYWIIKLNSDGDVSQPEMQLNPVNHIEL